MFEASTELSGNFSWPIYEVTLDNLKYFLNTPLIKILFS